MLTGLPPFYDENTNDMYRKILTEPLHFPGPEIVPPAARDLLTRLLDRNAEKRLGAKGAAEIKAHYFFHSIDWRKLLDRKYEPSFKPNVVRHTKFSTVLSICLLLFRLIKKILQISIVNSRLKRRLTLMSTGLCCLKRCSSNLLVGHITGLLLAWATLEAALKTHRSRALRIDKTRLRTIQKFFFTILLTTFD
jgi:serine/threonine protein kinase